MCQVEVQADLKGVKGVGSYFRHSCLGSRGLGGHTAVPALQREVVPLNLDAMFNGREIPLQRGCWEMNALTMLEEILRMFILVIKE
jgi:hypothetical protein